MRIIHDSMAITRGIETLFVGIAWNPMRRFPSSRKAADRNVKWKNGSIPGLVVLQLHATRQQQQSKSSAERAGRDGEKKLMEKALCAFQISGMM